MLLHTDTISWFNWRTTYNVAPRYYRHHQSSSSSLPKHVFQINSHPKLIQGAASHREATE